MNTANKIAWRYATGKKSAQAINIISWISMAAILFSTAAMIILFSVYNGIEGITKDLYTAFYPDIKISPKTGKYFKGNPNQITTLNQTDAISLYSYTLEDMVMIANQDQNKIAHLIGVNNDWFKINSIDNHMVEGVAAFNELYTIPPAIVGLRLAASLGIEANNIFTNFTVYHPKTNYNFASAEGVEGFNQLNVQPSGIFRVASMIDEKYIIVPIKFATQLFEKDNEFSTIAIKAKEPNNIEPLIEDLKKTFPEEHFLIEDKYEQNKTLYMILNSEKWAVYAILLMVMLVASFNMIGSLSMLALEKKKDIVILKSLGATDKLIYQIFLRSGLLLTGIGALGGLVFGYIICWLQQQFGIIEMGGGFIVNAYPVAFKISDFILVLISIIIIGLIASIFPATKAAKSSLVLKEE